MRTNSEEGHRVKKDPLPLSTSLIKALMAEGCMGVCRVREREREREGKEREEGGMSYKSKYSVKGYLIVIVSILHPVNPGEIIQPLLLYLLTVAPFIP